jgi:hypothetical protein
MADMEEIINKVAVRLFEVIRKMEIRVEVEKEDKVMEEVEAAPVLLV